MTPERVDLFGNAVAPTVEQGNLFDGAAGAARVTLPGAITAAELATRRDQLGAPKHQLAEPTDTLSLPMTETPDVPAVPTVDSTHTDTDTGMIGYECPNCGAWRELTRDNFERGAGKTKCCLRCGGTYRLPAAPR